MNSNHDKILTFVCDVTYGEEMTLLQLVGDFVLFLRIEPRISFRSFSIDFGKDRAASSIKNNFFLNSLSVVIIN